MPAEGKAAVSREILHQEGFYPEESSGLFVGISSFDDERFAEVRFAVDDAVDLAWIFSLELGLVEASGCVLALAGEPQKEVSRQRLATLLAAGARREQPGLTKVYHLATEQSQAGSPRGLFVLAAATHGLSESGGDYLVASDTQRSRLLRTAIAIPELFDTAATASAARRLVLLDACRERLSQDRAVADAAMSQSFAAAITEAEGLTVLSGSTAGGYAYDDAEKQNGVFTGALVDGLLGAAPADGRGFITVATLADFAQQRVQEWVQRHRREHLGLSRGIERRFDEAAQLLPLAIDPRRSLALAEYQQRRAAALARVHQYIGKILKGRHLDDIEAFLPLALPVSPAVEELLAEIESLDGNKQSQQSLLYLFGKLSTPPPQQPPAPSLPAPPSSAPRLPASRLPASPSPAPASPAARLPLTQPSPMPSRQPSPAPNPSRLVPKTPMAVGPVKKGFRWFPVVVTMVLVMASVGIWRGLLSKGPAEEYVPATAEPKVGELFTDMFGLRFHWIPSGTYTIGSPKDDQERSDWEADPHPVSIDGLWLAETEVTQAFWNQHAAKNPSKFSSCTDCPVEQVSWYEAVQLANNLSDAAKLERCYELTCSGVLGEPSFACSAAKLKSGSCEGYRLPSEAEWEVAARAQAPGSPYQSRYGELEDVAWYDGNSGGKTHPVGGQAANAWGLHDMLGNVWEWTGDLWAPVGQNRVGRGGSGSNYARNVRSASRNGSEPGLRLDNLGFRFSLGLVLRPGKARSAVSSVGAERPGGAGLFRKTGGGGAGLQPLSPLALTG